MKYKELFTADNGLFAKIFAVDFPTQYAAIFGDIEPSKVDVYAAMLYGERTLVSAVTSDSTNIVSAIIALNADEWVRQAETMTAKYDVATPITGDIERTETITVQETSDGTETGANVPFNDTAFTDVDKETSQDERNRTESRTVNETRSGTNRSIPDEISKELKLRRDNWRKNIIFALVDEITISVYE